MAKHKPAVLWPIHKVGQYPNVYLSTFGPERIKLEYYFHFGLLGGISLLLSRRDARLLAKRLNQILDQTR